MTRTSPRLIPSLALAGPLLLMLAPAVAGPTDDSAIPAAAVTGMTIPVGNCNDSGPGSLRAAVAGALSGDTIDMTGLACRRINLTSGHIRIWQDDLTLVGGGGMTVDANRTSPVFGHYGGGWLRIRGMTIARGLNRITGSGGCIFSTGSVELRESLVHWCLAAQGYSGGGIDAYDAVTLIDSQVVGNTAGGDGSKGGGIYTSGILRTLRSRICGNHAQNGGGAYVLGGGQYDGGRLNINYSTFSGNTGGALYLVSSRKNIIANSTISGNDARQSRAIVYMGVFRDGSTTIVNSTISGNTSDGTTVAITGTERSIVNSTIAFNQHTVLGDASRCQYTATVSLSDRPDTGTSVHIESTIAANNSCLGNPAYDIGSPYLEAELVGANNLITLSMLPLPPDTISVDPRLAPLADNGGRSKTHALLGDSPAIDAGNNAAGLAYDQRGPGFPRVKGLQADIGAYER